MQQHPMPEDLRVAAGRGTTKNYSLCHGPDKSNSLPTMKGATFLALRQVLSQRKEAEPRSRKGCFDDEPSSWARTWFGFCWACQLPAFPHCPALQSWGVTCKFGSIMLCWAPKWSSMFRLIIVMGGEAIFRHHGSGECARMFRLPQKHAGEANSDKIFATGLALRCGSFTQFHSHCSLFISLPWYTVHCSSSPTFAFLVWNSCTDDSFRTTWGCSMPCCGSLSWRARTFTFIKNYILHIYTCYCLRSNEFVNSEHTWQGIGRGGYFVAAEKCQLDQKIITLKWDTMNFECWSFAVNIEQSMTILSGWLPGHFGRCLQTISTSGIKLMSVKTMFNHGWSSWLIMVKNT